MRLAIVGSTELEGSAEAQAIIESLFDRYQPTVLVSGGAPGIDTMAEQEALRRGVATDVKRARRRRWDGPGGFKERNLLIARECDRLVRIVATTSRTYGSGWTRDRAADIGKSTEEYVVDVTP